MKKIVLAALVGSFLGLSCFAQGNKDAKPSVDMNQKIVIKYNNKTTQDSPQWKRMEIIKKEMEAKHPRIEIQLYTDLIQQGTSVTSMARGSVDMGLTALSMMAKIDPVYNPFTKAYNFKNIDHANVVLQSDLMKEMNKNFEKSFNLKLLSPSLTGVRNLNLRHAKDIQSPKDMKGVKIRVINAPTFVRIGAALGGNPTPISFSELYLALQTGTVDAQENPLSIIRDNKFYEVTEQIVLTGHYIDVGYTSINRDTWNKLSSEEQTDLIAAADKANKWYANFLKDSQESDIAFFKENNIKVSTIADMPKFQEEVSAYYSPSNKEFADWDFTLLEKANQLDESKSTWK